VGCALTPTVNLKIVKKKSALQTAFCSYFLKIVGYNPPYNFKILTGEIENLNTPCGLMLESGTKWTVRVSAITTTRKIVRLLGDPLAQGFQKEKSRSYTCLHYSSTSYTFA
jgi:hypothetical protein